MSKQQIINQFGEEISFDAAVNIMDDDLRERISFDMAPCSDQEFFDAYCAAHLEQFGEEFEPNKKNGQW